jgi:hypothetical protein
MYDSIGVYDWQTILSLLEAAAWVAVVGIGFVFLTQSKSKLLTKQNKQIIWLVFAAWAVASIGLATLSTYNYFADSRKGIVQTIKVQKSQYGQ